jgi:hypothetical protein
VKHFRVKRRVRTDPAAMANASLDEQIAVVFQDVLDQVQDLDDPKLRDLWQDALQMYSTTGDVSGLADVTKWRRPVVDMDEFLFGSAYLHLDKNEIYPGVLDACYEIDTDKFDEVVMKGAIGIGKTNLANFMMARDIYKLSCMRSPQMTYGIARGSPIVLTIQSVRLSTAKKVVFEELGRHILHSPYFMQKFRFNRLIKSAMVFPEHNISILPISSNMSAAISMNVIGGQLDEANFLQKIRKSKSSNADAQGNFDQAKALYNSVAARRKSRFINRGDLPCALYLISSSRFPDDFTEVKAAEAVMRGGDDDRIFVFEGSQWDVKGRDNRNFFTAEEFRVQIGNETYPSKVLTKKQPDGTYLDETPNAGCEILNVPMTFFKDFNRDVEGQIRDTAGRTTLATHPFIGQRDKIKKAFDNAIEHGYEKPMAIEEADFSVGLPELYKDKLRTDVKMPRHAHIDLGISHDACGIAVGHIAGQRISKHVDAAGHTGTEVLPVVAYDVVLRVVPPMGGEIQLEDVRKFLRKLNSKYNLNIETVTFDGFQSTDSRQLLNKAGFRAGYQSIEKIEPWRAFRDALYDERLLIPPNLFLQKELSEVERHVTNNKERVDHRPSGTKDVADAVVGVAAFLLSRRASWAQMQVSGGAEGLFLLGNPKRNRYANVSELDAGIAKPNAGLATRSSSTTQRRSIKRRPTIRK